MKFIKSYESTEMDRVAAVEFQVASAPPSIEEESVAKMVAVAAATTGRQDAASLSLLNIDGRGTIGELINDLVKRTQRSFTICRVWIHKAGV